MQVRSTQLFFELFTLVGKKGEKKSDKPNRINARLLDVHEQFKQSSLVMPGAVVYFNILGVETV